MLLFLFIKSVTYKLFIDDERYPPDNNPDCVTEVSVPNRVIARSSNEAISIVLSKIKVFLPSLVLTMIWEEMIHQ